MAVDGGADPYEDAFVLASRLYGHADVKSEVRPHDAELNVAQWREFLGILVDEHLLSRATAARFSTDFHGSRTLRCFQEHLLRWVLPEHDTLHITEDAFEALEENTTLVERMISGGGGSSTAPEFIKDAAARVKTIAGDLREAETTCRRDLLAYAHEARLFGSPAQMRAATKTTSSTSHAWQFQRDHQAFLLREEKRRRPIRVERHATDPGSSQVLLETFAPRLASARDISISMASATFAVSHDDTSAVPATQYTPELVVVLAVKRRVARAEEVTWLDTQVAAHRELLLSAYVQQYLGCFDVVAPGDRNGSEDLTEQLHCFELAPATPLDQLLRDSGDLFRPGAPIVRYLAREILLAMVDLVDQSTHEWHTRLTPANVLLSASRRRVFLGRIEFGVPIDTLSTNAWSIDRLVAHREAVMLGDLAVLLFVLLFGATLPSNLEDFRMQYLLRADISQNFTNEFLVTDKAKTLQLRVCWGDRFALVFVVADDSGAPWLLQSASASRLRVVEQRSSPVPTFTFVASCAGDHRLEFSQLGSPSRVAVLLTVLASPYLYDPSTRWTTLVQSCAESSATASTSVSLRQLLDHHALFQPLESTADVAALDAALTQCGT